MTVLEAIQKSTDFLAKRDVESPRLQAELLLAHRLKMPRMKLYLNFDRALSTEDTDTYREWIKRRSLHEPLQHIVGSTSFCGYEMTVNRHALVPRPETEILAESGWTFLSPLNSASALDLGTGTGCIAIALAAKCPNAKIFASDISPDALALAKENAAKNNVQIEFLQGNGFAALPSDAPFDLIISNPPYISTAEIETLQPEVRDFDPRQALDGGADGLDFYRLLATEATRFLKPDGKIMLEFGDGQAPAIREIFENEKWIVEEIKSDYSERLRILVAKI